MNDQERQQLKELTEKVTELQGMLSRMLLSTEQPIQPAQFAVDFCSNCTLNFPKSTVHVCSNNMLRAVTPNTGYVSDIKQCPLCKGWYPNGGHQCYSINSYINNL